MLIPLVDLKAQYISIKGEIDAAVAAVLTETAFVGGKFARKFEEEFAKALGVKYCIGVGNGTDALEIALRALGVAEGDEVIVPANTFIATAEAVTTVGGSVVFVDAREDDFCLDPALVRKAITPRTKAIIPVHLYGQPADMKEILTIAREHDLLVLEDAAQAHLAQYDGTTIGGVGEAACFSFYPGKNLGAYGDAGAIVTNDEALATKARMIANHGRIDKYDHKIEGRNSRLDGLQGAVLSVKLKHLPEWTKRRRAVAKRYTEALEGVGDLVLPKEFADRTAVYHLYVVRTKRREELQKFLKEKGIEAGIHYPIGLPFLEAYHHLEKSTAADFPTTHMLQGEILSLPIYAELSDEQISLITNTIKDFYVSR